MRPRTFVVQLYERRLVLDVWPSEANVSAAHAVAMVKHAIRGSFTLQGRLMYWYRSEKAWWSMKDDQVLLQEFYRDLESGAICAREEHAPRVRYAGLPTASAGRAVREASPPPAAPEAIVADERSLMIARCDPALTSAPLKFSYLLRGFAARPVTMRITSATYPGSLVYQRLLTADETVDGPHDAQWDGVINAGPQAGQRITPSHGPCRLELVNDTVFRDEASFVIPVPRVVVVEVGGLCFASNREIMLPDVEHLAVAEPGPVRVPPLVAIAATLRFALQHPSKRIFIAGHTDTVGRSGSNKVLSRERASNVYDYLVGDRNAWASHCMKHQETADLQFILAWIAATFPEYDCDPGRIDGDLGRLTTTARQRFRDRYEAQTATPMPNHGPLVKADWLAFFAMYDLHLRELLEPQFDLESARAGLRFAEPALNGFGEQFPSDRPGIDDLDSERNRRVEILFLDENELYLASDNNGEALYGDTTQVVREHIPLGFVANHDEIAFRFLDDEFGTPVAGVRFTVTTADGATLSGVSDDAGEWRAGQLVRGTCSIVLTNIDAADWHGMDIGERELPPPPPAPDERTYEPEEGAEPDLDGALPDVFDDDPD